MKIEMINVEFKPITNEDLFDFPSKQGCRWFRASYKNTVCNFRINSDLEYDYVTQSHFDGNILESLGYNCSLSNDGIMKFIIDIICLNKHKISPEDFE